MPLQAKKYFSITCFFGRIGNMKVLLLQTPKKKALILCILLFTFFGCSDKNAVNNEESMNEVVSLVKDDAILPSLDIIPPVKGKYVVVLLGYGYNEGLIKENLLASLEQEYGFVENDGIIIPLIYPDDFISFGYERISLLLELIEEQLTQSLGSISDSPIAALTALITLGAPEGTHLALADLQDATIEVPVFSIFSQDDILGTEAGSDLVIDYRPVQTEGLSAFDKTEETNLSYPNDVFEVIAPLINAALNWQRIQDGGLLIPALRTEFLKHTECNLFVYVDPQTGIRSQNHYVLESVMEGL